jgi:hypothetical protein
MNLPNHRLRAIFTAVAACLLPAGVLAQSAPLATFPATNIGSSSLPQAVTFMLPAAATISSITPVASVAGKVELKIGALSGCVADGTTLNPSTATCVIQVTFTPAYAGLHSLPIKVVTSAGNLQLGTVGTGVGPMMAFSPGITTIVAGTDCTDPSTYCTGPSVMDGGLATNGYLSGVRDYAIDSAGNIFLLLQSGGAIDVHRIDAQTGILTLVAGGIAASAIALDSSGSLYVAAFSNGYGTINRYDAATGAITNYAGGSPTPNGLGVAQQTYFPPIGAMQFDGAGDLYVLAGNTGIYRIDAKTTIVTLAVGSGTPGYTGDGGPASAAGIVNPGKLSFDSAGNLYFADQGTTVVRRVDAVTGIITTVAGSQSAPYNAAYSGLATNTAINAYSLANDAAGNIYFGDTNVLRLVLAPTDTLSRITGVAAPLPVSSLPVQRATDITFARGAMLDLAGSIYEFFAYNFAGNQVVLRKIDVTTSLLGFPFTTTGYLYPTAPGVPYPGANAETTAVTNIGNAPLVLSTAPQIANSSANPGAFALDDPAIGGCPNATITLAPGSSCLLAVDFTPEIAGGNLGMLTITDNAVNGNGTQIISLAGTGFGNALTVTPASLAFPSTLVGSTSASVTAIVTNNTFNATAISAGVLGDTTDYTETDNCDTSLAGKSSCTLTFTFKPQSLGTKASTFTLSGSLDHTQTITVSLTGAGSGAVSIAPTTIAFPSTALGASSGPLTATLTNGGISAISLTPGSLTDSTDFTQSDNCKGQVAAGGSCIITFTFTPHSTGALSSTYSIATASQGWTVALSGTGTAAPTPQASLSPTSLSFTTVVNTAAPNQSVTLTNAGTATLNIASVAIGGTNAGAFTIVTNGCGTTLGAGANCTIAIGFPSAAAGTYNATLTVTDNASPATQTVQLTGSVTGTAQAALTPATVNFGNVSVGGNASQTLTFSNAGTASLSISAVSSPNSVFALTGNTCGTTLAAGASCAYTVIFTPSATGGQSETFTATDSVGTQTAALSGTGVAPAAPIASLTSTASFPATSVGATATAIPLTLSNTGNAALTLSSVTLGGSNPGVFADTSACTSSLPAGSSCQILVTFTPTSAANFSAQLTVADNSATPTQTATLTGTGIAVATDYMVVAPNPTQAVQPGASAQFSLNIAPVGGNYSQAVALTVTGLPAGATASFNPASVTPGSNGAPSVLTVQTASLTGKLERPGGGSPVPLSAVLLLLPLLGTRRVRRELRRLPKSARALLLAFLALGATAAIAGCGGGYYGPQPQMVTLTVTGTSGTLSHSTTVTLTIQ